MQLPTISLFLLSASISSATLKPVKRAVAFYTPTGCFKDFYPSSRAFGQASTSSSSMTISTCANFCSIKGAPYFGLEYAKECYCGSMAEADDLQTTAGCTMGCAGAPGTKCGGENALSVYMFGYSNSSSSAVPSMTSPSASVAASFATSSSSSMISTSTSTSTSTLVSLGCYKDYYPSKVRALNAASTTSSMMTALLCSKFCSNLGAAYFGTEYSTECYCGSTSDYASLQTATACNMPCAGNAQESCGGDNQFNIYAVPVSSSGSSATAQEVSASQSTPTATSATSATSTASVVLTAYKILGCYKDFYPSKVRALNAATTSSSAMTAKLCSAFCSKMGAPYFGTEYASECYCGTNADYAALQSATGCTMACTGDSQEFCGGDNRITVYGLSSALASSAASFSTTTSTVVSATPVSFSTVGCVQDFYPNKVRALNAASTTSPAMTAMLCSAFCMSQNSAYFGTEYSKECYCGSIHDAARFQFTTGCTMVCAGNASQVCGGDNKISVYMFLNGTESASQSFSGPSVSSSTQFALASAVSSNAIFSTSSSAVAPSISAVSNSSARYTPYGCFADFFPSRRALSGGSVSLKNMTQDYCFSFCAYQRSSFFGLEYGQECWCSGPSDTLSSLQLSTACDTACSGNATQNCGGANALQIFITNPQYFGPSPAVPPDNATLVFPYGSTKVRGVNLGGWLVLEPWIRPSLFQQFLTGPSAADEYNFCNVLGYTEAERQLKQHWESFYTEADFAKFATSGLNHLRIPIGYWAFKKLSSEPFVTGQDAYLDKALVWAAKYGLQVWIDLHGALGSQNGFDNSGRAGAIAWGSTDTVQHTVDVLQIITARYGNNPVVAGIELLNEPAGFSIDSGVIADFNRRGYQVTKSNSHLTIIQDAFLPYSNIYNNFPRPTFANVLIDAHIYHIFSAYENSMTHAQKLNLACSLGDLKGSSGKTYTVVGEWSGAENDCATWLNGFNRGSRYDGTFDGNAGYGSCSNQNQLSTMTDQKKSEVREYISAQLDTYEAADGWIFWAGKTETADLWNFQKLFDAGLFPVGTRGFCSGSPSM